MISVVIPIYNSMDTIIPCLESVRNQTAIQQIKEIIVVNDGSTDDTLEILNKYIDLHSDLPITVISKENGGVSSARNTAIKLSTQNWIALLDSDDIWLPNKLEVQINILKKYPQIKFLGTNRNKEYVKIGKRLDDKIFYLNTKNVLMKSWPHTSTALINKEVFNQVGLFDEKRTHAEDGQLWMKIAFHYGIYYLYDSLEIAGGGKPTFGYSGLSANIKKMHEGCLLNIYEAYKLKYLNYIEYKLLLLYEKVKYLRRKVLIKKL
ncbi:glycosyltransferase family 2 protein [Beduini massiliensis]|uniref:glycosyltransferase family 2 protein n=1 Tax=Beduini massiliensis TaxID=1585974 RepID=UPI00059A8D23|nr:glycosyltransferase family A protein [Beduini massiliensis]